MQKINAIIFDMDGTLYTFDDDTEVQFSSSKLGKQIRVNSVRFLREQLNLSSTRAEELYLDFFKRYKGELSLAVEKELGINRSDFFDLAWNVTASKFISRNKILAPTLQQLNVPSGVLTAAPKIWAKKALTFLQIRNVFGEAIFTGDPDIRKPNPEAFLQLSHFWNLKPSQVLAIGDQEETDILPAKSLGMKTLRIANQAETKADFIAPDIITAIALLKEKGMI